MSLDGTNGGMVMPVMPSGNYGGGGFGGDGAWWLLVLFFALFGRNGGYDNGGSGEMQRGFDQQTLLGSLNGLTTAVSNGFANAEVSRCNQQMNLLQTLNSISMAQQNCCCENRAAVADLKYTVATEACADRAAVKDALQELSVQMGAGFQGIHDYLCQQEISNLKELISQLRTDKALADIAKRESDQTAIVLANNDAQTARLLATLNPTPVPAYTVPNPNCCGNGLYGSSCSCSGM